MPAEVIFRATVWVKSGTRDGDEGSIGECLISENYLYFIRVAIEHV